MTAFNQQTQAIGITNQIISCAARLLQLSLDIQAANNAWQDNGVANILNAMATTPLNPDGTPGSQDASPNVSHPLNVQNYPALSRALSANQIAAMLTVLNDIPTFVSGSAVSATPGVRGILNSATGT